MSALLKQCAVSVTIIAALFLAGCSQSTTKTLAVDQTEAARKPAVPQEIVPAKTAFSQMYTAARSWSLDIVLLKIMAKELPGFKNEAGKAAMWEATFASPSQHAYRVYTYSIAADPPNIHKGVASGLKMPWGGITRDALSVDLSSFNVDSDAAYTAATGDAADWLKKNPNKQLSAFEIGETYKFQGPVWFLMWGDKKAGYVAWVDASDGKVLKRK